MQKRNVQRDLNIVKAIKRELDLRTKSVKNKKKCSRKAKHKAVGPNGSIA